MKWLRRTYFKSSIYIIGMYLMLTSVSEQSGLGQSPVSEPQFFIKSQEKTVVFTRSDLLSKKDLLSISVDYDPAYPGRKLIYTAVPLKGLFDGFEVSPSANIQFHCLDGFSAPISRNKLMNESKNKAIALLAIETTQKQWPPLNPAIDLKTAGPFYLIWVNPKLSNIVREEWPYQLAGLEIQKSVSERYPAIVPAKSIPEKHSVMRGFRVFVKSCFTCHTMNLQGDARLGPDLNVPMNPTEYLVPDALKILIRDPQALRFWPLSKMHGFSKDQLSNPELEDVLAYLKYMAHKKVKIPRQNLNNK